MTGLFPPSSGDALIYGKSIVKDPNHARSSLGICPQQNILFERLTVLEHIRFFQMIKGERSNREATKAAAKEVGLEEFFHTTASALSGGNKRKLQVSISLCGDPRCVILDEPTSGMDPNARRQTWELLRKRRMGRTILLCTHFMDEAELLSDRIAVLRGGALQCSGSPLFLKNRFGFGYNLTVVSQVSANDEDDENKGGHSMSGNEEHTTNVANGLLMLIRKHIPATTIRRIGGKEVRFSLPPGEEDKFADCFEAIEKDKATLGVGSYGIENASLEEVFISLAEKENEEVEEDGESRLSAENTDERGGPGLGGTLTPSSTREQILILFWKRLTIQRRDWKGTFFTVVVPALLVGLVLLVLTISVPLVGPAIKMSPNLFERSNTGETAETDVWVGGGILNGTDIEATFESFAESTESQYAHVRTHHQSDSRSSAHLSQSLLKTINDRNHNMRYGAFAFGDLIPLIITYDLGALELNLSSTENFASLGTVNVLDVLDATRNDENKFTLNMTTETFFDVFYHVSGLEDSCTINTTRLREFFVESTDRIFVDSGYDRVAFLGDVREGLFNYFMSNGTLDSLLRDIFKDDSLVDKIHSTLSNHSFFSETLESIPTWFDNSTAWDRNSSFAGDLFDETVNRSSGVVDDFRTIWLDLNYTFDGPAFEHTIENLVRDTADELGFGAAFAGFLVDIVSRGLEWLESEIEPELYPSILVYAVAETAEALSASEWSNTTLTVGDLQLFFHELFGGDRENSIGYLHIEVGSALFDLASSEFLLGDLDIGTAGGALLEAVNFTLRVSVEDLDSLLPEANGTLFMELPSNASVLHNASSPHAVAAFNQAYTEYLFKECSRNPDATLTSINHPLPLTTQQTVEIRTILSVLASMFILIPYGYIPGAFVVFIVRERMSKAKHLQLVSGVSVLSYWISTYLYDVFLHILLSLCVMAIFLIYGQESAQVFVGDAESALCTALLTVGYGLSVLPFSYLIARRFDNHSSAQIAVIGIVFITGFVAVNAYFIMRSIESTEDLAETLRVIFRAWPAYNVGDGLITMATAYWEREILGADKSPLDWNVAGKSVFLLYALVIPYFALLLVLEYAQDGGAGGTFGAGLRFIRDKLERVLLYFQGVRKQGDTWVCKNESGEPSSLDLDVEKEAEYVKQNIDHLRKSVPIVIHSLWKVYPSSTGMFGSLLQRSRRIFRCCCCCLCRLPACLCGKSRSQAKAEENCGSEPKVALRGVSYALQKDEMFYLLGNNGAGKSTTLSILTGDISATEGRVYVSGSDITGREQFNGLTEARQKIGYCPQIDPLLELMTTRETLVMFGRIRGYSPDQVANVVESLLQRLTLDPHAEKTTASLSGGNKRKLALGVSLIGDPEVLLIDESSSGLDPLAKRKLWNLISSVSRGKTVISTTHNMEEAEALATRIAIMANGRLLCLGSLQDLKSKYLDGYTVDVYCQASATNEQVDVVVARILDQVLVGSSVTERHGRFLRFDVPSLATTGLGAVFRQMQALKSDEAVENYSIQQCTLEEVFVKLVNEATAVAVEDNNA